MPTPRVFLIRHGQTEWSLKELHTGHTDIPLTERGERQVLETAEANVGAGKLIDPKTVAHVYVSPRRRALQTVRLLDLGVNDRLPGDPSLWWTHEGVRSGDVKSNATIEIVQEIREWDYGAYEGITVEDVWKRRKEKGLQSTGRWNIFKDGCEDGESPAQVSQRIDHFISKIKGEFEAKEKAGRLDEPSDVVCVAHSHILAAIAKRWAGSPLEDGVRVLLDTAGVAVLSYEHHALDEPAIIVGPKT